MDDQAENLRAAFGDSSDGEDGAEQEAIAIGDSTVWERVEKVNGLWLCRNFISIHHHSDLLSAILNGTLRSSLVSNSNDLFFLIDCFAKVCSFKIYAEGWFVEESINQVLGLNRLFIDFVTTTQNFVSFLPHDLTVLSLVT